MENHKNITYRQKKNLPMSFLSILAGFSCIPYAFLTEPMAEFMSHSIEP